MANFLLRRFSIVFYTDELFNSRKLRPLKKLAECMKAFMNYVRAIELSLLPPTKMNEINIVYNAPVYIYFKN